MIRTHGLTHVALNVANLEESLQFYGKVFGMVEVFRTDDFIQVQTPGARDVIVFQKGAKSLGKSGGIQHFGFRMVSDKDLDIALNTIDRAGGKIIKSGEFVPGEPYVFFRDPDGYEVEVWFERPTPIDPSGGAEKVVRSFIDRINAHDLDGILELMTPDHVFTDALGNNFSGRETMRGAWNSFFEMFPNYHISVSDIATSGSTVSVAGEAGGGWVLDGKVVRGKSWKVPASWWARVGGNAVREWRVFCDTSWAVPPKT